jgi:glycosyltransferase involved in cell wall biosynthesis
MRTPSVRIVIPCFNHGAWVRDAVDSALALEGARVEVVVVDDGSDDGTTPAACDACAGPLVTVLHRSNGGLSAARNTGAAGAATDYLAFLDADDLLLPHFARDLGDAIESERAAGRDDVSHAYGFEQVTGRYEYVWRCPPWDPVRMLLANLHPVTALVRRDVFEQAGGFDESLRTGHEDWEFWIRCIGLGYRGVRVEKPVFVWRRFSEQSLLYTALDAHAENVRKILTRHADLYRKHALPVIERSQQMLHDADATWLDEDYRAIHLQNARRWAQELTGERDEARHQLAAAQREIARLSDEIHRVQAEYEEKAMVRLSRALHERIEKLPAPLRRLSQGMLRTVGRLAPRRRS